MKPRPAPSKRPRLSEDAQLQPSPVLSGGWLRTHVGQAMLGNRDIPCFFPLPSQNSHPTNDMTDGPNVLRRLWGSSAALNQGTAGEAARLDLVSLEDRLLFSGVPLLNSDVPTDSSGDLAIQLPTTEAGTVDTWQQLDSSTLTAPLRHEVLFVDERVDHLAQLLADLQHSNLPNSALEVVVLESTVDGIQQVADYLERSTHRFNAVHIASHGTVGSVELGATWLDQATLASRQSDLLEWQQGLADEADLLFYACDVGHSAAGASFLDALARLLDVDLAASTDRTGHESLGGDWELEWQRGVLESEVLFSTELRARWHAQLNLSPVTGEFAVAGAGAIGPAFSASSGGNVASDSAGNYVVVWEDLRSGSSDVYAQIYNSDGTVGVNEFLAHTANGSSQTDASVAMASNGNVAVVWTDNRSGTNEVYWRLFDLNGNALTTESQVSTLASSQDFHAVDFAADGSLVIVFHDAGSSDVYFQRYDAAGTAVGVNTLLNNATTGAQTSPDVAVHDDGSFTATWTSDTGDGNGWGIYARRFDSSGVALGNQFQVNQVTLNDQLAPAMDVASNGDFVIAWSSNGQDGSGVGIYGRRFDATGTALGNEFLVNTFTAGNQTQPHIALNSAGDFVIAWQETNAHDGSGVGIYVQQFASAGNAVGGEQLIPTTTNNDQILPSVSYSGSSVVVTWQNSGTGSDGIYARQFTASDVSVITVTTVDDTVDGNTASLAALSNDPGLDGFISLREAILAANNTANAIGGPDVIQFNIGSGTQQIDLLSALPAITDAVLLDGWTQSGFAGTPRIVLEANGLVGSGFQLTAAASNSTIRGFVIRDFTGDGILIDSGSSQNTIAGNYIGSFGAGGVDLGAVEQNTGHGIRILGDNNTIGGSDAQSRNVIGGNQLDGILLSGSGAHHNTVFGNTIGLNAVGDAAVANAHGIELASGADQNRIGSTASRNFIAGNTGYGVYVNGADSTILQANYFSLGLDGWSLFSNGTGNILVENGANNTLIGTNADGVQDLAERNVVAGSAVGILISGVGTTGTAVYGNYIGTDATGILSRGNTGDGIRIENGATSSFIGGGGARYNIVAGNGGDGIQIDGETSGGNFIQNNWIGLAADGSTVLGNQHDGIMISGGADNTTIGGIGLGNLIVGARIVGLEIDGASSGTLIYGNFIGQNAAGTVVHGSGEDGILLENSASNTTIGGTAAGQGNTIVDSGRLRTSDSAGILLVSTAGTGNVMVGNSIYGNRGRAIDLTGPSLNNNDSLDVDSGPNNLQNSPTLAAATTDEAGTVLVSGSLSSTASTAGIVLHFYASPYTGDVQVRNARRYLGSTTVATDGSGQASFTNVSLASFASVGEVITATATVTANTSELSNGMVATASAGTSGPSALTGTTTQTGGLQINNGTSNATYLEATDGSSILGGLTQFTMEFDFQTPVLPNDISYTFASYATETDGDALYFSAARWGATDRFILQLAGHTTHLDYDLDSLFDGERHSLGVTWDQALGAWSIYVDGVLVGGGTGLATGQTLSTGGTLIFGHDIDVGADTWQLHPGMEFRGTLYDVRIFGDVRTSAEIGANFRSTLPYNTDNLLANWRMDDLSVEGITTDSVSGNNLHVRSAVGPGFTATTPTLTYEIREGAATGTVIGRLAGTDTDREALIAQLLAADPGLVYSTYTGKFYKQVTSTLDFSTAQTAAMATSLNGIAGQLVTIRSATENNIIFDLYGGLTSWLGGSDATSEGSWVWLNGLSDADPFWHGGSPGFPFNGAFAAFAASPVQPEADPAQNVLTFRIDGWHDANGSNTAPAYLIEWDADAVLDASEILTYTILGQSVTGAFAIDPDTGVLSIADGSLLNFEGTPTHTLTIRVTDGTAKTFDQDVTLTLNNALELTPGVPSVTQHVLEDAALVFSTANGNAISVTDTSASTDAELQVSLSVNHGTLTLAQTTGLSIVGGADGTSSLVLQGLESAIQAALDGLSYVPPADYHGSDVLTVTTSLSVQLEGHYTFDGGSVNDQGPGTAEHGTLAGNASVVVDPQRGDVLSLDGVGDYVAVASDFGSPADVTLAAWVQVDALHTGTGTFIEVGNVAILDYDAATETIRAAVYDGAVWTYFSFGSDLSGSGWQHLAFTWHTASNTGRLYVNGQEVGTAISLAAGPAGASQTRLGTSVTGSNALRGLLDDARIYSRSLTAAEISALASDQASATSTIQITVDPVNDAPVIQHLDGDSFTYHAGDAPTVLDQLTAATVGDVDTLNFAGGNVTASLSGGSPSEDVLSIRHQGSAPGQIGFDGALVSFGGLLIGTATGGTGGVELVVTLNANATHAAVQALLQNITFNNTDTVSPTSGARLISLVVDDGAGGVSVSSTVNVNVVQATSALIQDRFDNVSYSNNNGTVNWSSSWTELAESNGPTTGFVEVHHNALEIGSGPTLLLLPTSIDGAGAERTANLANTISATLSLDLWKSGTSTNGALTLEISTNGTNWTTLQTFNFGSLSTSRNNFSFDISSYASATTTVRLVGSGSVGGILLSGHFYADNISINYVPNTAPVVSFSAPARTFTENQGVTLLDDTASLFDAESPNFAGGTLTLDFLAGGSAEDRLAIENQGTGLGQVGVAGNDVTYEGTLIGTFVGGTNGATPLVVTFNANADEGVVRAVLRAITYNNVSDAPNTTDRQVRVIVTDGDGGTSAASIKTIQITAINDAPILTNGSLINFLGTDEETPSSGTSVAAILASSGYSDPDAGASSGLAVIQTSGLGSWEYSVDGLNWTSFGTVSSNSSLLLNASTLVRYLPNGQLGETAQFDFRAWDQTTHTPATAGNPSYANTLTQGGTTAFSTQAAAVSLLVAEINDAPLLDATGSMVLLPVGENDTNPAGQTVASIIASAGGDRITDVDGNGVEGIAIQGATSLPASGLQYSLDGGQSWVDFGAVTDTSALLLRDSDLIRLLYAPNNAENPTLNFTFRAWDQTSGSAGSRVDVSVNGGVTAFSGSIESVTATVIAAGDAPTDISPNVFTIAENTNTTLGLSLGVLSTTDVDPLDTFTYTVVGGPDAANFTIGGPGSDQLIFTTGVLDFESQSSYTVRIRSTDASGLWYEENLLIQVTDVNEAPSVGLANTLNTLPENSDTSTGIKIADVVVTDDALGSNVLSLSGTDAIEFELRGTELWLRPGAVLDAETNNALDVTVLIDDGTVGATPDGLVDHQVLISDVNEFSVAPVIDSDATMNALVDDSPAGTPVGITAWAVDNDSSQNLITYALDDDAGGRFAMDATTGVITLNTAGSLDYYIATSHNVVVRATSADGSFSTQAFTIGVLPSNAAPQGGNETFVAQSGLWLNVAAPGVLANDTDADGDSLTLILETSPSAGTLVWSNTGGFSYLAPATFGGQDSFTYRVSDGRELSGPITVTLQVVAVASPTPVGPPGPTDTSPDDSADETLLGLLGPDLTHLLSIRINAPTPNENTTLRTDSSGRDSQPEVLGPPPELAMSDHGPASTNFRDLGSADTSLRPDAAGGMLSVRPVTITKDQKQFEATPQNPLLDAGELLLGYELLTRQMSELTESLQAGTRFQRFLVGSATVSTGAVTIGYVMWTLRGSSLLASVLSTMPVWRFFDPLPIAQFGMADKEEKDESLADLLERSTLQNKQKAKIDPQRQAAELLQHQRA